MSVVRHPGKPTSGRYVYGPRPGSPSHARWVWQCDLHEDDNDEGTWGVARTQPEAFAAALAHAERCPFDNK
jgi:hypothetical protein